MHPLVKIENLCCEYQVGIPALKATELEFFAGEISFVVGASGSGKSTLLEALGLMTKTAKDSPSFSFALRDTHCNEVLHLDQFWEKEADYRSSIRSKYFSFIFQQENMFSSLNALENMMLPLLGCTAQEQESAHKSILSMAAELLPEVELGKPIMEYSGGQRQRFAFIRALAKPHTILLADEPTGNLDPLKAQEAMDMVKSLVNSEKSSAIIVSHDICLAISKADRIILIDKPLNESELPPFGIINPEHIFRKAQDGWKSSKLELSDDALQSLIEESLQSLNLK